MARVQASGTCAGISIAAYLGRLVEAELARRRGRPVDAVDPENPPSEQAVAALAEVRASIDELNAIAGRLARSAVAHGGSWADVGSSLRLNPDRDRPGPHLLFLTAP